MAEDNRNEIRIARRGDWKTQPMPERHETFTLDRTFSSVQMTLPSIPARIVRSGKLHTIGIFSDPPGDG